jgi:hypothetical protein
MKLKNNKGNRIKPESKQVSKKDSFWCFLFQKNNIPDLVACFVACLLGYVFIHHFYPYPATYSDSFSYVLAAAEDRFFIFRPFGYSAFLQFVHSISHSLAAVIIVQFVIYFISVTLLSFVLKRTFPIHSPVVRILLELSIAFSPVAIYMCNALMSDVLFGCCVLLMIAMLIIMIFESSWVAMALYVVFFFISLFVRYSAMFFPIAVIPVILFMKKKAIKWTAVGCSLVAFIIFYQNVTQNMYKAVHLNQFSTGFDGWQLANNAMNMLPFIETEAQKPNNNKVAALHNFCYHKYDSLILQMTDSGRVVTAGFLWDPNMPLKQYLFQYMNKTGMAYPVAWAKLGGSVYSDYGKWLILNYPVDFWKYYLKLNIPFAFYPKKLEMVGHYAPIPTGDKDIVGYYDVAEDQDLSEHNPLYEKKLSSFLPLLDLLTWILMLAAIVVLVMKREYFFADRNRTLVFALILVFGFIYYGTTVFASPVVIRYWLPMHALKLSVVWMALSAVAPKMSSQ